MKRGNTRKDETTMYFLAVIILMIFAAINSDPALWIAAGLFAIADAIGGLFRKEK